MADSTFVFTIAARNYLGLVTVLFNSVKAHCGDVKFCCFVVDGFDSDEEIPIALRGSVVDCRKLGVPRFEEMAFKYDVVEFSTALKPFIFRHIFKVEGYSRAVYLDPDLKLFENLEWLEKRLNSKSIVVTPHLLNIEENHLTSLGRAHAVDPGLFLFSGDFNLGFIAIKNDASGMAFVDWWGNVLLEQCFYDTCRNLCVDQKWVNLVTGFFGEQLEISRDPGANVAYWNLHERRFSKDLKGHFFVNGSSLKFIHFSNIDLSEKDGIANGLLKNRNIDQRTHPECAELYSSYIAEVLAAGHVERKMNTPYRFNYFDGGLTINKLHRRLFATLIASDEKQSPFSEASYFYRLLKKKGLLNKDSKFTNVKISDESNLGRKRKILERIFYLLFKLLGTKKYLALLSELRRIGTLENNTFLIKGPDA